MIAPIVRTPFLVTLLLALALVGTVLGAAFYFGFVSSGGGVASASNPPAASFVAIASTSTPSPAITVSPSPSATPSAQPSPGGTYVVQDGDLGLSVVAEKFGIPWQLIAQANNIPGPDYTIHVGDVLIIPALPEPSDSSETYVVKPGDSITKIATQLNVDPTDLADFNNLVDWNSIHPGDILYVPGPGWTPRPTASAE